MRDVVSGLELYSIESHYGVYLRCDQCGKTLDAPVVNNRISANEHDLVQLARELGWSGELSRNSCNDLCPKCTVLQA